MSSVLNVVIIKHVILPNIVRIVLISPWPSFYSIGTSLNLPIYILISLSLLILKSHLFSVFTFLSVGECWSLWMFSLPSLCLEMSFALTLDRLEFEIDSTYNDNENYACLFKSFQPKQKYIMYKCERHFHSFLSESQRELLFIVCCSPFST